MMSPNIEPSGSSVVGSRVLFACEHLEIGGFTTHTLCFGRALRRRGHEVGALIAEPFGDQCADLQASLDQVQILRRGLETRSRYLRRTVDRVRDLRPDVVINNGNPFVQAAFPFLAPTTVRISVAHSITPREVAIALANPDSLDAVIAVSENVRTALEQRNEARVPVATIPVGVECGGRGRVQERAALPLRLLFVGRLWPEKNIPGLIRVLSSLHQQAIPFRMTIVGDGPECRPARAAVASAGFARQVAFLGARPRSEVRALLDENDFLLLTSHYEGTPHAVIEAMASGLVVLASHIPGSTDQIVKPGTNGFLCDREVPEDYVAVLRRFASGPCDFNAVSRSAQETVSARYSVDVLALQYETLFTRSRSPLPRADLRPQGFSVSPALLGFCPGFVRQCRHRAADLWRRLRWAKRPLRPSPVLNQPTWRGAGLRPTTPLPPKV